MNNIDDSSPLLFYFSCSGALKSSRFIDSPCIYYVFLFIFCFLVLYIGKNTTNQIKLKKIVVKQKSLSNKRLTVRASDTKPISIRIKTVKTNCLFHFQS